MIQNLQKEFYGIANLMWKERIFKKYAIILKCSMPWSRVACNYNYICYLSNNKKLQYIYTYIYIFIYTYILYIFYIYIYIYIYVYINIYI